MEKNSILVKPSDGLHPISGQPPEEGKKSLFSPIRIIGLILLAVIIVAGVNHYRGIAEVNELEKARARIAELQQHETGMSQTVSKNATPATVILKYGEDMLVEGKGVEYDIPEGESLIASPVATVDIDWYINGQLFQEIRAGKVDQKFSVETVTLKKMAFVLSPREGQAKGIRLVYCRYKGKCPWDVWFLQAQKYLEEHRNGPGI